VPISVPIADFTISSFPSFLSNWLNDAVRNENSITARISLPKDC